MKMLLTTEEGYPKDKTPSSKKRFTDKKNFISFTGSDAPVKMVRALMQKYGIKPEQIGENI